MLAANVRVYDQLRLQGADWSIYRYHRPVPDAVIRETHVITFENPWASNWLYTLLANVYY
jgi:hypothetical protein